MAKKGQGRWATLVHSRNERFCLRRADSSVHSPDEKGGGRIVDMHPQLEQALMPVVHGQNEAEEERYLDHLT